MSAGSAPASSRNVARENLGSSTRSSVAAAEYSRARMRGLARLRRSGVQLVDAYPSQLPRLLVNKYWEMKRAGQL
jgi:hypothetical protein